MFLLERITLSEKYGGKEAAGVFETYKDVQDFLKAKIESNELRKIDSVDRAYFCAYTVTEVEKK